MTCHALKNREYEITTEYTHETRECLSALAGHGGPVQPDADGTDGTATRLTTVFKPYIVSVSTVRCESVCQNLSCVTVCVCVCTVERREREILINQHIILADYTGKGTLLAVTCKMGGVQGRSPAKKI